MERLKDTVSIFFGILLLLILSPLIIIFLIGAGITHLAGAPRRKREAARLKDIVSSQLLQKRKYALLWYDRNTNFSDYLEQEFIPRYKKFLLVENGHEYGVKVPEAYRETVGLIKGYDVHDANDDCCDGEVAMLYVLNRQNLEFERLSPVINDETNAIQSKKSKQLFEKAMEACINNTQYIEPTTPKPKLASTTAKESSSGVYIRYAKIRHFSLLWVILAALAIITFTT